MRRHRQNVFLSLSLFLSELRTHSFRSRGQLGTYEEEEHAEQCSSYVRDVIDSVMFGGLHSQHHCSLVSQPANHELTENDGFNQAEYIRPEPNQNGNREQAKHGPRSAKADDLHFVHVPYLWFLFSFFTLPAIADIKRTPSFKLPTFFPNMMTDAIFPPIPHIK